MINISLYIHFEDEKKQKNISKLTIDKENYKEESRGEKEPTNNCAKQYFCRR